MPELSSQPLINEMKNPMRRVFTTLLVLLVLAVGAAVAYMHWWVDQPLKLAQADVHFSVPSGSSAQAVAQRMNKAGVRVPAWQMQAWLRYSGQAKLIKAGAYEVERGDSFRRVVARLVKGEQALHRVTFIEGWTLAQARAALAKAPDLKAATQGMSEAELMKALGQEGMRAEGRFFPDTYNYARGSSDLEVLRHAFTRMEKQLDAAWSLRSADSPLTSPEQLLIMASIVEKETGRAIERPMVAAVFVNRLKIGMPLQTDPTVIYGMGSAFDGNLRKKDLQTDTPYNSYTRKGLPPTPIALPGKQSLMAVMQPAQTKALYFVARGNGTSHFSDNLQEHNRAVNKYQRGQRGGPEPMSAASAPAGN